MNIPVFLSVFLFVAGTFLFGLGFHNIDLSVNFMNQGIKTDSNMIGAMNPMSSIYTSGLTSLVLSFLLLFSSLICLLGREFLV
jgi:hypothetical protein